MKLAEPLYRGVLLRRYKRFLADVQLTSGETVTAHCPNPGRMSGCNLPGSPVYLTRSSNPRRKLPFTWELVQAGQTLVVINTTLANTLAQEAIRQGLFPSLRGFSELRSEVPYGENSRIDFLLMFGEQKCYVEVKNVSLAEKGVAMFPDAVTRRGQKHLRELMAAVSDGHRGVALFVINRGDAQRFAPADHIDSEYGRLLREAERHGVELLAGQSDITPPEIRIVRQLPVTLPPLDA